MSGCHRKIPITPLTIHEVHRPNILSNLSRKLACFWLKLHKFPVLNRIKLNFKPRLVTSSAKVFTYWCRIPQFSGHASNYMPNFSSVPKKPPWIILELKIKSCFQLQVIGFGDKVLLIFRQIQQTPEFLTSYILYSI